jgi:hypothetical protein
MRTQVEEGTRWQEVCLVRAEALTCRELETTGCLCPSHQVSLTATLTQVTLS